MTDRPDPIDPLDLLRAADPAARPPAGDAIPDPAALFQEIVMTDPSVTSSTDRPFAPAPSREQVTARRPRLGRRLAFGGVAAATAAVVGFGAVALVPSNSTAAEAAVLGAAQRTESTDSGSAVITVTADGTGESLDLVITTAFDGQNLSAALDAGSASGFGLPFSPEVRVVDGVIYANVEGTGWVSIDDPNVAKMLGSFGLPVDIRDNLSTGIVELVKASDNVEELGPDHYRATVSVAEARALAEQFPSLGLYTDQALPQALADQLLTIDLVLDSNGLIDVVTVSGDATNPDDAGQAVAGSISIDLNDLGTPQAITAPEGAMPLDLGNLLGGN